MDGRRSDAHAAGRASRGADAGQRDAGAIRGTAPIVARGPLDAQPDLPAAPRLHDDARLDRHAGTRPRGDAPPDQPVAARPRCAAQLNSDAATRDRPRVARLAPPAPRLVAACALRVYRVLVLLAAIGMPAVARADFLPSRPITFWGERLIVSGEAALTIGPRDKGYFNAIDYYHDALNLMRFALSVELQANDRLAVLGQIIDQTSLRDAGSGYPQGPWQPFETNRHVVRPYALFVRVRPWLDRPVTIQAGRIPPVFGAYPRQDYGATQSLISLPLAYHYPTSLRPDTVPQNAIGLARWRGYGWRPRYRMGTDSWGQGVPLVSALRWDTGVQVQVGADGPVTVSGAVTSGTLSSPRFEDDNGGKQISGRVALRPVTGLVVGLSGARGEFLDEDLVALLPPAAQGESYTQRAIGADVEYSRGYWLVRSETIVSWWKLPRIDAPFIDAPLRAWSTFVEARWKFTPRWYLAARGDRLGFSTIDAGPAEGGRQSWDAPVTRVEIGGGYSVQRNVRLKLAWQYDWRDAGMTRRRGALATQIVYWF